MDRSKRRLLQVIGAGTLYVPFSNLPILHAVANPSEESGIFYQVFSDASLRSAFGQRLVTAHLSYIDPAMLSLIEMSLQNSHVDQEVYEEVQISLKSSETYSSATNAQMHNAAYAQEYLTNTTRKSVSLLHDEDLGVDFKGHLDIESDQAYISRLWDELPLSGQSISMTGERRLSSTFDSALDMPCCEQLTHLGNTVDLNRQNILSIESESMSLITAFRGLNQHDDVLVSSLLQRLKPGGHLILQEENIDTRERYRLATISQYVEDIQAGNSWDDNMKQTRVYRSIDGWQRQLFSQGLTLRKHLPLYAGNSESSTLMHFQKTS